MRVDLRGPLTSARPTRGALVATLFAVVMIALVAFYSLSTDADEDVALQTDARAVVSPRPAPTAPSTTTSTAAGGDQAGTGDEGSDGPTADVRTVNYALSLDDVGDESLVGGRSDESAPASPTTQRTTTTEAPATQTTVIDLSGSTTSMVDDGVDDGAGEAADDTAGDTTETSAPESTDTSTSQPAETTTTAAPASNPDGFVDAGHGVLVPPILIEIRRCESTHNYQAANPTSTARGAYQFLRSSWAAYGHADRYGVPEAHLATNAQQDEAALITWQRDGTRPWAASRSCWG